MGLIYLARHGTTAWNEEGRLQGHRDIPLSPTGRAEAALLAKRLAHLHFDAIAASDLQRARETAEIVANGLRHPVQVEILSELREMGFGVWEGLTPAEVATQDPEGLSACRRDPVGAAPPGGESPRQVAERVRRAFDTLWGSGRRRILVVSHGGVLKLLILSLLGADLALRRRLVLDPASLSVLRYESGGARLLKLNDTCHLKGQAAAW